MASARRLNVYLQRFINAADQVSRVPNSRAFLFYFHPILTRPPSRLCHLLDSTQARDNREARRAFGVLMGHVGSMLRDDTVACVRALAAATALFGGDGMGLGACLSPCDFPRVIVLL